MATFKAVGPDGKTYTVDAPDAQAAGMALDEMMQAQGGGQPPQPMQGERQVPYDMDRRNAFSAGFDPTQDSAETAAGLDDRLHGQRDTEGAVQTFANGMMMGAGDEFMGALAGGLTWAQGRGFDEGYNKMTSAIRGDIDRYAERHPVASTALDVGGSLATAWVPGGAAVRGANLATKVGRGAAAGAAYGAAQGYASGEGGVDQRLAGAEEGAKVGSIVGGAVPVIGAGIGRAYGKAVGRKSVPSVAQLDDAASALYQRADNAGIAVQPRALQRLTTVLPQRMANMGFDPVLHPKANRVLEILENRAAQGMQPINGAHRVFSLGEVENMRRVIRQAITATSGPNDKADRQMAQSILDQFDNWMTGLQPRDMLSGGPSGVSGREAIQIVQEARGLWTRKSKGDVLADLVQRAELDDDVERGLRREFRNLARNKERMRQFTAGEKDAIRKVAQGGPMGWLLRAIGSLAPGASASGVVRGTIGSGAGFAAGGPVGAAVVPAAAYAAKKGSDAMVRGAVRKADATVRAGGAVPIDAKAAKTAGDYATRLIGAAGQAGAPEFLPPPR
jgi:hypothetical protein